MKQALRKIKLVNCITSPATRYTKKAKKHVSSHKDTI